MKRETISIRDRLLPWRRWRISERSAEASGEEVFRVLAGDAYGGIAILDREKILETNRAFASMFGYEPSEVDGEPLSRFLDAGAGQDVALGPEESFETLGLKKDGTTFDAEIRAREARYQGRLVRGVVVRDITERKRVEEIRHQRDVYEGMLTAQSELGEGLVIVDDGRIWYANDAFCEISGYDLEELRALPSAIGLVAEEERDRILDRRRRRLEGEEVETSYATVLRRKDGRLVDIEVAVRMVRSEEGSRSIAIVRDVTGRKEAEKRLGQTEARYRALVEQIPAVTYIHTVGEVGRSTYVSPQVEAMFGYTQEESTSDPKHWIKILHPADRERVLAEDRRTDETGEPFRMEYRQFTKSGSVVWVRDEAVLIRDVEGEPLYWLGVQYDVTERKRAEAALQESELRLRTVITNVPVVLFALNRGGMFTLSEGRGLDVLGLEPGEMVGRSISELYGDEPEILADVDRALNGEEFRALNEVSGLVFETWYSPLRASTGEVSGVIGVSTDITERKRAEEDVKEANRRLEELAILKADFTAMVAHELDTPLAVIRGFADMLATGELEQGEQSRALDRIQAETDLLVTLVADVRVAAAVERDDFAVEPESVPIGGLLRDAAAFVEALPGDHPLVLEAEVDGQVRADPYRIDQVLRNLLSNAAKYSPPETPIGLRAYPVGTAGRIRIEVADQGSGIDPYDRARIFEKFGRGRDRAGRKVAGTGLGLYLTRRILQAHGSELTLETGSGGGSVFSFELERPT